MRAALAALAIALCAAFPAAAKTPEAVREWRFVDTPLVVLANDPPPEPDMVRTALLGDEVLSAPIGVATAASLWEAAVVEVAGQRFALESGAFFAGAVVERGYSKDIGEGARVFCALPKPPPVVTAAATKAKRYRSTVSLCLVDGQADGVVEKAFLVGARQPADWQPVTVGPLAYEFGRNVALPRSRMSLSYRKGAALQGLILALDFQVGGRDIGAVGYLFGEKPNELATASERELRWKSYPNQFDFGPVGISIEGRDETDRSIRYRITSGFKTLPLRTEFAAPWLFIAY